MTTEANSANFIFEGLCRTCEILEEISCAYFLAGGTLLGARRDGDIIKGDVDFDLDCFSEDGEKILAAAPRFAAVGLTIRRKQSMSPRGLVHLEAPPHSMDAQCIVVESGGRHLGDISMFTVFSDGIARRFDQVTKVYFNPKMAIPGWYYGGSEQLSIRGRAFSSVRSPDMVLEKVYGADWRTPLTKGQFAPGRHPVSGSIADADIETLMLHASANGWPSALENRPKWPQTIAWVGWPAEQGREWILHHEPLLLEDIRYLIEGNIVSEIVGPAATDKVKLLMRVAAARAVQGERRRHAKGMKQSPRAVWLLRVSRKIPLPRPVKVLIKRILTVAIGRSSRGD